MFKEFYINGDWWKIVFVNPWDKHLVDRTGEITLATSDYSEKIVFISESLNKELLTHVFYMNLDIASCLVAVYFLNCTKW